MKKVQKLRILAQIKKIKDIIKEMKLSSAASYAINH